jgi:hypothetical protein
MSSPSGASHIHSGKFAARCRKDNAVHCGHLPLHGDCQAKGGQVKSPYPVVGKIYNKRSVDQPHSSMSEDDNNFDDNFEEEFGEDEDEFGNEDESVKLYLTQIS